MSTRSVPVYDAAFYDAKEAGTLRSAARVAAALHPGLEKATSGERMEVVSERVLQHNLGLRRAARSRWITLLERLTKRR